MNMTQAMEIANRPETIAKMERIRAMEKAKKYERLNKLDDVSDCCNAPITASGNCANCGENA